MIHHVANGFDRHAMADGLFQIDHEDGHAFAFFSDF